MYNCIIQIGIVYYWFYLIAVKYLSLIDKSRDWRYKEEDLGSFPSHAHSQWVWFEEAQTNTMPSAMEVPVHPGPWPWKTTGGIQRVQLITPFILAGWADFIKIYKLVWPHVSSITRGFQYCLFGAILKRKLVNFHAKQLSPHRFHCAATYRRKIADSHHVQVQLPPTQVDKKNQSSSDLWKMC